MRALVYRAFGGPLAVEDVPEPVPSDGGVVVEVGATGVCRSDWHGWQGHDPDIVLPHVPGHELAGTVAAVGPGVRRWAVGDRVTVPFVCACGRCEQCLAGDHQVCPHQTQPGFTHWGSFASHVALDAADVNLVALPEAMSFSTAASLGCRYATSFRAVAQQGRVQPGEQVVVFGCGGVGLSAVQVAVALGASVVAVDVSTAALELAVSFGAVAVPAAPDVVDAVRQATGGGAHLALDALGSPQTCEQSLASLRPRGRHVQVGLLPPSEGRPVIPMERVVALELEVLGSHGMSAAAYPDLLALVEQGRLRPDLLVTQEVTLAEAGRALREVGQRPGVTVVTVF